ncbi:MAG: hypothetical protein QOF64_2077 [Candidatus Binatota bacterium]|jgi:DNA-binding TFAR19-related protein (PDSD5 family)|nr:hypothetical protein [Candidatus Binatota bacterium]
MIKIASTLDFKSQTRANHSQPRQRSLNYENHVKNNPTASRRQRLQRIALGRFAIAEIAEELAHFRD